MGDDAFARIAIDGSRTQPARVRGHGLVERHMRDQRGVPERLQVHEGACVALQFDHNEPPTLIEREDVDTPAALGPVAVLLGEHEQAVLQHIGVVA